MGTLFAFPAAAAAAYLSTNIDGFALLMDFSVNERYRASEIAAGQLASVGIQLAASIAIMNLGGLGDAPFIGLAGIVPLAAGLRRIVAGLGGRALAEAPPRALRQRVSHGAVERLALVTTIATCGAIDNVLVYAGLFVGHGAADLACASMVFAAMALSSCALAFIAARSRISLRGLRTAATRIAPIMTTAVGAALLIRFGTFEWIWSLA
ncbi:cadmium resistance transporter [Bordetella genomosp. 8]|uniref:cadmium resistance transporter n=1 Tax=Bordetella genomosp. 8 TaxID=1416806 RepID=UPI0012FE76FF|nr:cadmium resistance transporter [Bordetella genomosp. 8]